MRVHLITNRAPEVKGPLPYEVLATMFSQIASPHQFQLQEGDNHTVVMITGNSLTPLDYAAVSSAVEFLESQWPHGFLTQHVRGLFNRISPRPKPEPEVQAANEKAVQIAVEPEPQPKWKARVRTKLDCGRVHEEQFMLDEVSDLERIVANSPFYLDHIKNIKIRLEHVA